MMNSYFNKQTKDLIQDVSQSFYQIRRHLI